ncbi:MAG TPA: hypothetical protein VL981_08245 [Candidatus Methylacidiphilales bacterium]|nr:hypothetical protein [Candidatus Methylacidiphilales bacterium]
MEFVFSILAGIVMGFVAVSLAIMLYVIAASLHRGIFGQPKKDPRDWRLK